MASPSNLYLMMSHAGMLQWLPATQGPTACTDNLQLLNACCAATVHGQPLTFALNLEGEFSAAMCFPGRSCIALESKALADMRARPTAEQASADAYCMHAGLCQSSSRYLRQLLPSNADTALRYSGRRSCMLNIDGGE